MASLRPALLFVWVGIAVPFVNGLIGNATFPASSRIRQGRLIGDAIGASCFPLVYPFVSPCLIVNSICMPSTDSYSGFACTCKFGFVANADNTRCISDSSTPLSSTECVDESDCDGFPGTICRRNTLFSSINGAKPTLSSTMKRCQCAEDRDVDPTQPLGCQKTNFNCSKAGSTGYCRKRNPEDVCLDSKCSCPAGTGVDNVTKGCARPDKKTCEKKDDCPLPDKFTTVSTEGFCDRKLGKCSCAMAKQGASPSANPPVPEIPAGTAGTSVYDYASRTIKCVPIQVLARCADNEHCAVSLNQTCYKSSPDQAFGSCLCAPLKRPLMGGLTCRGKLFELSVPLSIYISEG
ncbi:hypothetical protein RvY_15117-2 [Ramazzottius varieornatus]|uniref:EB domain-containing protein n=1 Tax=Ramazzottius varieornatus TaxID=947166 RepID=A0A1D1VVE9_RAMVA|nr:hypothetical protein RvY_15117-2 [Ramazzottius varieornatus]